MVDKYEKNYDVIKERCIHHMIILTILTLAHSNVEINTFPMIYYKGLRNQNLRYNTQLYSLQYFACIIFLKQFIHLYQRFMEFYGH